MSRLSNPKYIVRQIRRILVDGLINRTCLNELCDKIESDIKMANKRFTRCLECGETCFEPFMVHDEVWRGEARLGPKGVIHMKCLEELIGRPIDIDDLTEFPINDPLRYWFEKGVAASDEELKALVE